MKARPRLIAQHRIGESGEAGGIAIGADRQPRHLWRQRRHGVGDQRPARQGHERLIQPAKAYTLAAREDQADDHAGTKIKQKTLGRTTGIEPATTGTTNRRSTN
jgi:hypothetical protein